MKKSILVAAAVMCIGTAALANDVLNYLAPQGGSGWEFLQVKGPAATFTVKAVAWKPLALRVGCLGGTGVKPSIIAGPSLDPKKLCGNHAEWLLDPLKVEIGIFGGVMFSPGEVSGNKLNGLLGVSAVVITP